MKKLIRDEQRIENIWHCIRRIKEVVTTTSRDDLPTNEPAQEQLFFNLMILGEASNRLSEEFRAAHADIPWSKIIGMRNVLIHDYTDIDFDIAWQVVSHDKVPRRVNSSVTKRGDVIMKVIRSVATALVAGSALLASAGTTTWKGEDGSWNDPTKWDNGVPGTEDSAELPYAASRAPCGYVITVDGDFTVGGLHFTDSGSPADNARGPVTFVGSGRLLAQNKSFYRPVVVNGPVLDFSGDGTGVSVVRQDITVEAGAFIYTNAAHTAKMYFNSDAAARPMQAYLKGGRFQIDVYSCYDVPTSRFHQTGGTSEFYQFVDTSNWNGYRAFPQLDVRGGTFILHPCLSLGGRQDFDFGTATIAGATEFAGGAANTEMSIRDRPHFAISSLLNVSSSGPVVRFPHGVVFESLGDWRLNNLLSMSVREAFTIDTLDQRDGVTSCAVTGWENGFRLSARNDITIKGGGSVDISNAEALFSNRTGASSNDLDVFDAFRIKAGTSFRLDSKDIYRANRIYAEEFELGPDATLTFKVWNTIVVATRATIGSGAKLVLEVPDAGDASNYKGDVLPVLYAGADSSVAGLTVELTGTGAANYDVKRDAHAIWLWRKTYAPTPGTGAQTWVGGATDANVTSGANWGDGTSKSSLWNFHLVVGANSGSTINVDLENQSIYRFYKTAAGPVTVTGNPIAIMSPTVSGSYAGVNNYSRYPLTFRNKVRQPSSVAALAAQAGYVSSNHGGIIEFLGGLDVANQLFVQGMVKIGGIASIGSLKTSTCTGFASMIDVLNGAVVSVTNQPTSTDQIAGSFLRVDKGGELRFTGGTGYRSTKQQKHDVNGTLAFEIPFVSAASNHCFAGSGRLEMAFPRGDEATDSTIHIAERLKFYPGDWPTASTAQPGRILRLAVDTHATLGALQDWTYGPEAGAVPTTDAINRTLTVANGETLTIDTENPDTHAAQTITFADPLSAGGDVVKQGAGTLAFACTGNTVAGMFRVTEGSLALGGALAEASGWTDVLTAKSIDLQVSFADGDWLVKQVPGSNDTVTLRLKKRAGLCVIVR